MTIGVRAPPRKLAYRGKGTCCFCGEKIVNPDGTPNERRTWHQQCADVWTIANQSSRFRDAVFARDHGVCRECGLDTQVPSNWRAERSRGYSVNGIAWNLDGDGRYPFMWVHWIMIVNWHADHVVPLWSVDRDDPDAFRFWTLENAQTLCDEHHAIKTAREAKQRAKEIRVARKMGTRRGEAKPSRRVPF
jgi:hypothetical protein